MRILILSCKTGGGHNSCAKAIEETFRGYGSFCKTEDSLSFVSKSFGEFMSKGHSLMYRRFPKIFGFGYSFAEKHPGFLKKGSPAYGIISKGGKKLFEYIEKGNFDAVICTHVFSGIVLKKAFENKERPKFKTAFVATDYTCSPGAESFDYDFFFIPDSSLSEEFIGRNVPPEKIIPSGIPVGKSFCGGEKKKFSGKEKNILLMCGSMGCGPFKKILEELSKRLCEKFSVTAVCGNNEKLRKSLYKKYKNNNKIHIVGYTENISSLLDKADICVTKPGGLSSTEAAGKSVPMVLINVVEGCEKHNLEFWLKTGGAVTAETPEKIAEKCFDILNDEIKLLKMSEAFEKVSKPFATEKIYRVIRGEKF